MKLATLAISIVSTAAYFALAVLGWGGFGGFFSHSALTALVAMTFGLSAAALTRAEISAQVSARTARTAGSPSPLR